MIELAKIPVARIIDYSQSPKLVEAGPAEKGALYAKNGAKCPELI